MTDTTAGFQQLLDRIDRTAWGKEEQALLAQAVAMAVESGDEQLEYQARMRQTSSANMAGDTDLLLSSFAWCLAKHDSDPVRFPSEPQSALDLMWHFKWMAGTLRASSRFSLAQIHAVLDDMEKHYRTAGLGMSGVLTARFEVAWLTGELEAAERYREELMRTPRDSHSHCEACSRSQQAGYFAETNQPELAINLVQEMLDHDLRCANEPKHALSRVLVPYLEAGRLDDARRAHLRAYRLAMRDPDSLSIVAHNIQFAAITGNEARALAMVERHMSWLAHDRLNETGHLTALTAFGLALDAVAQVGHGDTIVRGAAAPNLVPFFGAHEGEWTAAELAEVAWSGAERIAAAFDARNGSTYRSDRLARTKQLRATRFDVPIRTDAFTAAVPAPIDADTPDERFARALALADLGDLVETMPAAQRALADNVAANEAQLLTIVMSLLTQTGAEEQALEHMPTLLAALRREGETVRADVVERLGLAGFGRQEQANMQLLEEVASQPDLPDDVMSDLLFSLALVGITIDDIPAAMSLIGDASDASLRTGTRDRAAAALVFKAMLEFGAKEASFESTAEQALAISEMTLGSRAVLLQLLARDAGRQGNHAAGLQLADEAASIVVKLGSTSGIVDAFGLAGMLAADLGDNAGAVQRFRVAIPAAERSEHASEVSLRYRLGVALYESGDAASAVDVLEEVLAAETESNTSDGSRGETVGMLARAHEENGQPVEAAEMWEFGAGLFRSAVMPVRAAQCLAHAGRIRGALGDLDAAQDLLNRSIEIARRFPDHPEVLVHGLHLQAQATVSRGDDALALLDEATALAEKLEDPWTNADLLDTRARALDALGNTDAAVAFALQAADAFSAAEATAEAAKSELFAARALNGVERFTDAVPLYHAALEHMTEPRSRQGALLELGDLLERLGRHAEAAEARAEAEGLEL